jgi:hypothetical protein
MAKVAQVFSNLDENLFDFEVKKFYGSSLALGAVKTGIKPRVQPPYKNNIPSTTCLPRVAGSWVVDFNGRGSMITQIFAGLIKPFLVLFRQTRPKNGRGFIRRFSIPLYRA